MSEFTGQAGTIYVEKAGDKPTDGYEVWFEDFCILGKGNSELEALENAGRQTIDILELIVRGMREVAGSTAAKYPASQHVADTQGPPTLMSRVGGVPIMKLNDGKRR